MSITTKTFLIFLAIELIIGFIELSKPRNFCPVCNHMIKDNDTICYSCGYELDSVSTFNFYKNGNSNCSW